MTRKSRLGPAQADLNVALMGCDVLGDAFTYIRAFRDGADEFIASLTDNTLVDAIAYDFDRWWASAPIDVERAAAWYSGALMLGWQVAQLEYDCHSRSIEASMDRTMRSASMKVVSDTFVTGIVMDSQHVRRMRFMVTSLIERGRAVAASGRLQDGIALHKRVIGADVAALMRLVREQRREIRAKRRSVRRSIEVCADVIGDRAVSEFASRSRMSFDAGGGYSLSVKLKSTAMLHDAGNPLSVVLCRHGRPIARLCVSFEGMLAADQITAFALHSESGTLMEVIDAANIIEVHPRDMTDPVIARNIDASNERLDAMRRPDDDPSGDFGIARYISRVRIREFHERDRKLRSRSHPVVNAAVRCATGAEHVEGILGREIVHSVPPMELANVMLMAENDIGVPIDAYLSVMGMLDIYAEMDPGIERRAVLVECPE